jgi:FlaA1/EpsC-like NDP-sugar epimerase
MAEAIGPGCKKKIVGIRPGEKIHEEMITTSDSYSTVDLGKFFAILHGSSGHAPRDYLKIRKGKAVPTGFSYNSGQNSHFLKVQELRELIRTHVYPGFQKSK